MVAAKADKNKALPGARTEGNELVPSELMASPSEGLTAITELSNGVIVEIRPISGWDYLIYQEKITPNQNSPLTPSLFEIQKQQAKQQLIRKACKYQSNPLTSELMDELDLSLSDFNQLIYEIMAVDGHGETHDDATNFTDSNDFSFGNKRIKVLKVSWRYGMKFQADMEQGLVNAYKNLVYKFIEVNGKPVTEERLQDADDINHQLMAVIYKRLGKLAFRFLASS